MKKTFEDYYQEVISTLEESLECTTSDAQGIAMPYEDIIHNAYVPSRRQPTRPDLGEVTCIYYLKKVKY